MTNPYESYDGYPTVRYTESRLCNQPNYQPNSQINYPPVQQTVQPSTPTNVIVLQNPVSPQVSQVPVIMGGTYCHNCNMITNSYVTKGVGTITWVWALILFIFTGICCWIPFVCDSCKQQQIKCTNCHSIKSTH